MKDDNIAFADLGQIIKKKVMQVKDFQQRRGELLKQIGTNNIAIIFAAKTSIRSGKEDYPYRQDSDFYYLTGFTEPESIAVLIPGRRDGEFILFNRKHDPKKEVWYGLYAGQEGACREFGADQAFAIELADVKLPKLLAGRKHIYFNTVPDGSYKDKIDSWLGQAGKKSAAYHLTDVGKILHEMRLRKSQTELKLIRKAAEITAVGFLRAIRKCRPGLYEFELKAELLYEFIRCGGSGEAFATVVGGGASACVLHYAANADKLLSGDLVLVDAGAEYKYYCADVSRTLPVNGKFTQEQHAIYVAVLETQLEVIKQIRPGVRFNSLQLIAERVITENLVNLGLLKGKVDNLLAQQSFKQFFMHKIGHWLGLDAHDVGEYCVNGRWCVLEPGMVLTIEPGIYIAPHVFSVAKKWQGIGVRIEDEILVTENGCEVLTQDIPKNIADIVAVMKK